MSQLITWGLIISIFSIYSVVTLPSIFHYQSRLHNRIDSTLLFLHSTLCKYQAITYNMSCEIEQSTTHLIKSIGSNRHMITPHSDITISNHKKKIGFTPFGTTAFSGTIHIFTPYHRSRCTIPIGHSPIRLYEPKFFKAP